MTAPYFEKKGFYVKAVNFLDMAHSDGWNCLAGLDTNPDLVTTVANTIIQNTSGPKEADDFWSRAELNLLMALIHYVCNLKDARGNLLPLEQRSLGDVYKILAYKSVNEINRIALIAPNVILNIIRDYEVVEKKTVTLPDELVGLVKCNNPKCITNNEPMPTRFDVIDKEKGTIRCHYCERKINKEDIIVK